MSPSSKLSELPKKKKKENKANIVRVSEAPVLLFTVQSSCEGFIV